MSDEPRATAPSETPVALTIAGSDSGGGAGIQADTKTIEATGAFATSVLTAVTAQNTQGVEGSHLVPNDDIAAQYDAVTEDFDVRAAKTGMLATAETVEQVARFVREAPFPVVVDPVMVATSGDRLLSADAEESYESLVAAATLVTPNTDEAAVLTGLDPDGPDEQVEVGERLLNMGAGAALVKGGHGTDETVHDVLVTPDGSEIFSHPRVDTDATHGSGCTLSAAIAARLAQGEGLVSAVEASVTFMERAIRYHHDVGHGPGTVNHLVALDNEAAREPTREHVADLEHRLEDVETTGIAAATPYAENSRDIVEAGGESFGTSDVAATLLAVREPLPAARFAVRVPTATATNLGDAAVPTTDHPEQGDFDRPVVAVLDGEDALFVGVERDGLVKAIRAATDA
ncbi:bifunctional hydroxymethylpyrimidine kinase/phosphomethylpyrimidine kinase [Halosegnis longus]|uniref:bifunctional hydroxymethylpyrimidine kinase/phosphomethylpyrimidine kinase n=1 Tax=Halosegnis longus TaxID=2216012 RepID=UPI00096A42BE|nr:bifunctional hydroxymethylpyrimidine kinase/phosphomethylpyrimidine kinase [Salella cibi]